MGVSAGSALKRAGDPRVVGGVVIMAVSAYLGLAMTGNGPETELVAVAQRDLPAGIALQEGDVKLKQVLIGQPARYVRTAEAGGTLIVPLRQGELVPLSAVSEEPPKQRLVAVPVEAQRLPPDLARGALVDVWSTGDRPVLVGVGVDHVSDPEQWSGSTATVVLAVEKADVSALLAAARGGTVDLTVYQLPR